MGTSWTRRWLQRPEDEVRNSRRRAGAAREVLDRNSSSVRERPVARGTGPRRRSLEKVRVSLTQGPRCNAFALRRSYDDEGKKALGRWRTQKYENYGSLSEITDCAPESTELSKIGKNQELSLFRTLTLARRQGSKKKKIKERKGMTPYELRSRPGRSGSHAQALQFLGMRY